MILGIVFYRRFIKSICKDKIKGFFCSWKYLYEFIIESRMFFMCGIVGMIGLKNVILGLIGGLEKLEYCGYDLVGIFVLDGMIDYLVKV